MAKVSNFTTAQVERIKAVYLAVVEQDDDKRREAIKLLADELKMSTRQVIGKLSTMKADGVEYRPYNKAPAKPSRETHQQITDAIAALIDADGAEVDVNSLARCTKPTLILLREALMPAEPEAEADAEA